MGDLINPALLVSSFVGFIIFWMVCAKYFFPPVFKMIDERRESIEAAFQEVDDAKAEVARLKAEYEANLAKINAEAQAKLQEAVTQGQALAAQLKAEAEQQREKLLARTQEDIQREKEKALAELRNEAIDLSFAMASKVLKGGIDRPLHDKLVSDFVKDLQELN